MGFHGLRAGNRDAYDRAALFADRTDDCVNPGDRPGDQPTRLALTIGVATARSHGITMPPSMKTLANRVAP